MFFTVLTILISTTTAFAAESCRKSPEFALQELKKPEADPEERADQGRCLSRYLLDKPEVAQAILNIIKNPREDLLLREDLITAFAESPLRRKVKVEQQLAPKTDAVENEAVTRTLASAEGLLAVTQAVKSMNEIVPTTRFEGEFFRALSEIALDDTNHVVLREVAVSALEKASAKIVASGIFDDRNVRMVQETLRTVSARGDNGSYFTGASRAYDRLASAGLPHFAPEPGRMISSTPIPAAQ